MQNRRRKSHQSYLTSPSPWSQAWIKKLIISLLLVFISLDSFADQHQEEEFSELKWNHIHDISNTKDVPQDYLFFPHRANAESHAPMNPNAFENAKVCGGCHVEIYNQWKESMMAYSWEDPFYRGMLKRASEASQGKLDYFCTGCHAPVGLVTGQINSEVNRELPPAPGEAPSNAQKHIAGVDCEACHNMTGRTGIDNGAYVIASPASTQKTKFGPRKNVTSPYHQTEYSEFHTRSDYCGTCHNVTHPINNVPIERTYDEWLESSYAKKGIECQDCHMKEVPGKSTILQAEEGTIFSHNFVGANSTVLSYFGEHKAAEAARRNLQQAASIQFVDMPERFIPGEVNTFKVRVNNDNAGHKLPTGFPEGREMWLDLTITDALGKQVFRLGAVKNGKTEPGTRNFKVHLGNAKGEVEDIAVWNVTHVISDNRILPDGYELAEYAVLIPNNSQPPFKVDVTLNYWPFSQALADEVLGKDKITVDIVNMTSEQMMVQ